MARKRSAKLQNLLFVRGLARQIVPVAVLWSAMDWYLVKPVCGVIFLLLTGNYVLVWLLSWVAKSLLNGPWRVRPWQTLVLLLNFVSLPIVYYFVHGEVVWGFLGINALLFAGLYASTAILMYFGEHLPMSPIFAASRGVALPVPESMAQADSRGS